MRTSRRSRLQQGVLITGVCLIPFLLVGIARYFRLLETLELKSIDRRWQISDLRGRPDTRDMVLVAIDSATEETLGSRLLWSPRDYYPLIATLQQAEPAAIMLVIWFNREWPEDPTVLPGESLLVPRPYYTVEGHWRQAGILQIAHWAPSISNLQEAEVKGFSSFPLDPVDGIYRTAQLLVRTSNTGYAYSLELHAVRKLWGLPATAFSVQHNPWLGWRLHTDDEVIPVDSQGRLWIRYVGQLEDFQHISAVDVYQASQTESPEQFRKRFTNKIVLIGATASGSTSALTPGGELTALEMRANAISTLLNRDGLTRWTTLADLAYLLLCGGIAAIIALVAHLKERGTFWITRYHLLLLVVHLVFVVIAFLQWRWWVGLTGPSLAIAASAGVTSLYLAYLRTQRLFSELRTMQQQLVQSEKEAAYGAMAAQVRHELRNLLNSIRSPAEMVRNNFERDDPLGLAQEPTELVAEMNVIIERVARLSDMVENELSFFQNSQYRFELVYFQKLVQEALQTTGDVIQAAGVTVETHFPPEGLQLEADPHKLTIALVNLIRNACEAMSDRGKLRIEAVRLESQIRVVIKDTGRGIEPPVRERIFEPFFTTKPRGLGLGLANVRNIVKGHGGSIQVESEPGHGTHFSLLLPVAPIVSQRRKKR